MRNLVMLRYAFERWLESAYNLTDTARDRTTELNSDVRMPRQCTTAKPRIGPEPKISRAMPTISVVTLESRIVAQARS